MEASSPQHAQTTATPAEGTSEEVEYVLQKPVGEGRWDDVATFSVPKRSQTRTVLLTGLREAGIAPADALKAGLRFRILDQEAAHEHGLKVKEPREPEIELV